MLKTRTGAFPIGFRRGWSDWQKDLGDLLDWARASELGVIDLGSDGDLLAAKVTEAGFRIGSVDLKDWRGLISPDSGKRKAAVDANRDYVATCSAGGAHNFFAVMLPEDPSRPRCENFSYMVEGLCALAEVLEANESKLVIEGWPGPGALCCTPESYRETFRECLSSALGVNYDPSHLIRMGIDPIRFLQDFGSRVFHVHGKDTEIFDEALYEFGTEQPATLAKPHGFGSHHWRYTIPGHGCMRWTRCFEILADIGYRGAVSIELEDENFNGSEEGEKAGLLAGSHFLTSC